jgi:hypothetical protein
MLMSKRNKSNKPRGNRPAVRPEASAESRTSDAATVCWTVSITTLVMCNIAAVAAQLYARGRPEARGALMLGEMLLISGAVIGVVSLVLLPVVYRVRRLPPPPGLVVFAVCAAVAPILAVVVRAVQS